MPEEPKKRSIEHYGQGQSGYTAGRVEPDPSLGLEGRNVSYPKGTDEPLRDVGDDERFTGRGGRPWAPQETESGKDRPKE